MVGTGGYASYPMVKAAAQAHIPTAVHESNSVPGLTTRMLEEYADVIMVGFEDCRQHYRHPERIMVTGTPVRGDFFEKTPQQARQELAFDDGRPVVVSFWGSLGASHMNEAMLDFSRRSGKTAFPSTMSTPSARAAGRQWNALYSSGGWTPAPLWMCGSISTTWPW